MTLDSVRKHPWFTRDNPHLNHKGKAANPVALATQMLESLHINFSAPVQSSQRQSQRLQNSQDDRMDIDSDSQSLLKFRTFFTLFKYYLKFFRKQQTFKSFIKFVTQQQALINVFTTNCIENFSAASRN